MIMDACTVLIIFSNTLVGIFSIVFGMTLQQRISCDTDYYGLKEPNVWYDTEEQLPPNMTTVLAVMFGDYVTVYRHDDIWYSQETGAFYEEGDEPSYWTHIPEGLTYE